MLNLTPEEASRICMDQCRAMCCRGPLILRLEADEVAVFHREAVHLGTTPISRPLPTAAAICCSWTIRGSAARCWIKPPSRAAFTNRGRGFAGSFLAGRSRVAPFPVGRTTSMIPAAGAAWSTGLGSSPLVGVGEPFTWYVQRQWRD